MSGIKTIDPNTLAQPHLHRYLLEAVAPRPICFASTIDKQGQVNLSPFSFFNVFSSNPPILIFSPARSGRDGSNKHSLDNVMEVHEVVINVVNYPMVEQMSLASTAYDKGVNEFLKAGFTQVESEQVSPPRVGEAPVALECKVNQVIELGKEGGAGNLVIAEVLLMHIREEYLGEDGYLDTQKLDLVARMGDSWYCRASGEALFEIPKPLRAKGIGVDSLPASVQHSNILTGNDLGRLGNQASFPTESELQELSQSSEWETFLGKEAPQASMSEEGLHQLAKEWLSEGRDRMALAALFAWEQQKTS